MPKPSLDDLKSVISTIGTGAPGLFPGGSGDDGYEAVLWTVTVNELVGVIRSAVRYVDTEENDATTLRFRRSPSPFQSKGTNWSHAVVPWRTGRNPLGIRHVLDLEVHAGVQVLGINGVLHECDIAVVPRGPARRSVSNGQPLSARHVLFSAEAKFLSDHASVPLGYARGLLGLHAEFGRFPAGMALVSTRPHVSAEHVLRGHGLGSCGELLCDQTPAIVNDGPFRREIRRAAQKYLADPYRWA